MNGGVMNFQFFSTQIIKLQKNYGEACYSVDQIKAMYQEFGHVEISKFSQAIDWILMNDLQNRWAPNAGKIWGAIKVIGRKQSYQEDKERMKKPIVENPVSQEKITEFFKGLRGELE